MTLRRALIAWLAFALVASQSLAFVHRVVHAPWADEAAAHWHEHDEERHGVFESLFAHGEEESTCRLLDALGQDASSVSCALAVLPALPAAAVLAALAGDFIARWTALFDARGPPPIR